MMKIVSLNVGLPRKVEWKGKTVNTGIFKVPVEGSLKLNSLNLEGDAQADLTVHGGIDKAVYAYPIEHYQYWRNELPEVDFSPGVFGENLTLEGLLENKAYLGDCFRVGSTELMITQPRTPCYKLGLRFNRLDMIQRFLDSQRTGFYFRVLRQGEVSSGDQLELISRNEHQITIADVNRLYLNQSKDLTLLQRVVKVETLPLGWRNYFQKQIE